MKKIGIFGGTFNPIHIGHINIARQFAQQLSLDTVLVIPDRIPPHKEVENLLDAQIRYDMCVLACEGHDFLQPCALEINKAGRSYTVDTITLLEQTYPDCMFYLLMGSDMFMSFTQWYRYEDILKKVVLAAGCREFNISEKMQENKTALEAVGAQVTICNIDITPISSTIIREMIGHGLDVKNLLPQGVYAYIQKHHLYGEASVAHES